MAPNKDTSKGKREAAAARRIHAVQLRTAGASYRSIGARLGTSHVQAFKDVRHALKDRRIELGESTAEMIALEGERLDAATLAISPRVMSGDLFAIDRWIRISESRRRLLGLDAPKKIAPTTPDGNAAWQPFDPKRLRHLSAQQLEQLEELLAVMNTAVDDEEEEHPQKPHESRWKDV
jgi:hypothetical protein